METMKAADIVLDFDLYPRGQVDNQHVGEIREAMRAGIEMPPVIIDKKSKRAVDGFHRIRAELAENGEGATIQVVAKKYTNDKAMFLDAMRFNVGRGHDLTPYDKARSIIRAGALKITDMELAEVLKVTVEKIVGVREVKTAKSNGKLCPIKRTIQHMAGKPLTRKQVEANARLGGMKPRFYVNQIVTLIEADLLDKEDEELAGALRQLHELLGGILASA